MCMSRTSNTDRTLIEHLYACACILRKFNSIMQLKARMQHLMTDLQHLMDRSVHLNVMFVHLITNNTLSAPQKIVDLRAKLACDGTNTDPLYLWDDGNQLLCPP